MAGSKYNFQFQWNTSDLSYACRMGRMCNKWASNRGTVTEEKKGISADAYAMLGSEAHLAIPFGDFSIFQPLTDCPCLYVNEARVVVVIIILFYMYSVPLAWVSPSQTSWSCLTLVLMEKQCMDICKRDPRFPK